MKLEFLSILFFSFFQAFNLLSEVETYRLGIDLYPGSHELDSNKNYKFINPSKDQIFFIETQDEINFYDSSNRPLKSIVYLSKENDYININKSNEFEDKEINIKVTSVLKNNFKVNVNIIKALNNIYNNKIFSTIMFILYADENEDQIAQLNSIENSVLFSFWKYEFNVINPDEFYPINRKLFKRYDGKVLSLKKKSIYIIFAELYKLDCGLYNTIEIFLSPLNQKENILLSDKDDYLYLKKSKNNYFIKFNQINLLRVLKLSQQSNNSVVTLDGNIILDSKNNYYELTKEEMESGIELLVSKDNCLIEIIYFSDDDVDVLDFYSEKKYKLKKKYTIVKIPKIKCTYEFQLSSPNIKGIFFFGYNHKISKNKYFYRASNAISFDSDSLLSIKTPYLYNTDLNDDEFQIFEIYLDEAQLNNDIYLSYNPTSFFKNLYKKVDEEKAQNIIDNIANLLKKFYIYQDISKIPPEIKNLPNYHHEPLDLIDKLKKISTEDNTHLGLYQNIHEVLSSVRDLHLNIKLNIIEQNINIASYTFFSLFELYIDNKERKEVVKIKIRDIFKNFSLNAIPFLKNHENIPLKLINGTDPFEFIQNFGKYKTLKNKHAQFTNNLNLMKNDFLYIYNIPYDLSDLINIEYEFENGDIMNMDYYLLDFEMLKKNKDSYSSLNKNNNQIFNSKYLESKKVFEKEMRFLNEKKEIEWKYYTNDSYLKCRVDKDYHFNVFLQTSFDFENPKEAEDIMKKCIELFYSNDYKIIGIEDHNGGGIAYLYQIWHQLIQQKTLDKTFRSLIINDDAFDYFQKEKFFSSMINVETCKRFESMEEMDDIEDNYGYSELVQEEIKHHRSKLYEFLDQNKKIMLNNVRNEI